MSHEYNRAWPDRSESDPPLLHLISVITLRERKGIIKNQNGRLESDIVLAEILLILRFIPFKSHLGMRDLRIKVNAGLRQYVCTYTLPGRAIRPTIAPASQLKEVSISRQPD